MFTHPTSTRNFSLSRVALDFNCFSIVRVVGIRYSSKACCHVVIEVPGSILESVHAGVLGIGETNNSTCGKILMQMGQIPRLLSSIMAVASIHHCETKTSRPVRRCHLSCVRCHFSGLTLWHIEAIPNYGSCCCGPPEIFLPSPEFNLDSGLTR